ncbi:MAG: hypothetical protein GY845_30560, partial [Planctomycetes bacterium]|nr:hypothetical protein [Planctomycetota bacterium]
ERKQQGVAATPQEEKEQEGTLTFKHYHPFPLLLEKESLRMPLHGPGALIATLEDENGEGIPDKQVYFFVEPGSNLAECFRSAPDDIWRTSHPDLKTVGYGYNYTDKDGTAYVNYLTSGVLNPDGLFKVLTRDGKAEGTISAVVLKPGSDEEFEYKQSIPVAFECIAKVVGTTGEVMIRNREYIGNTTGEGYVNATAGYSLMPADSIKINPGASVEIVWLNGNRAIAKVPKVMLVEGSGYVETKPQKLYLLATAYDSGFKSPFDRTSEWINGVVLSEAIDFIIQKIPLAKTIKGYAENLWAGKDKVIELMTNTDEAGLKGNTTTRIRVHSTVLVHQTGDRTEIYT